MQLLPRYLLKNRINLVADLAGFVVEYKPVYQRQIQVYKGIENTIEFRLLNADQKPVDTSNYTPKFLAFDENQNLVIEKNCEVLDDGSSATRGLFFVKILENELLSIHEQFLTYTVYLQSNTDNLLTYANSHFGNGGVIKVSAQAFPGSKPSKVITDFYDVGYDDMTYFSEAIDAEPGVNGNSALHTAVIYSSEYVGKVTVQVSLDNQIDSAGNWADIAILDFTGEETEPVPVNFNGVFRWIRFKIDEDPTDKITKILLRN